MMPPPYMDCLQTSLHACSLETIQLPIQLPDGHNVWPMMVSCYQFDEARDERFGDLNLFLVTVPDVAGSQANSLPLSFGPAYKVLTRPVSGILDGQWYSLSPTEHVFATTHASGQIQLHSLHLASHDSEIPLETDPLFYTKYLGQSDSPESDDTKKSSPLCLSLDWDRSTESDTLRVVSCYSNGTVAIHDVIILQNGRAEFVLHDSWKAHSLFASASSPPAEVWSCCWIDAQTVVSCGDEGNVHVWDTRCTTRPMQTLQPFSVGATCARLHPRRDHVVAIGSYDETIAIYDLRQSTSRLLGQTAALGGGIWRLKWHPYRDDRLLVGAMHGGCRVVKVRGLGSMDHDKDIIHELPASIYTARTPPSRTDTPAISCSIKKEFMEHESMVYGVDWLVCPHPTQNGYFEAAASCSFYDRAVFLWDSVF